MCVGVYVCARVEREYHRCSFAGGQLIRHVVGKMMVYVDVCC